ncbi:efflux RND transporter periplasmic adaptor subunit [Actinomyces culturomici]|uniref:efflux RND transporter periplasmic adaptor subunit n=1 Tax=Actinomyces culturomici TaxID=1926276 RepID=UPI000E205FD7|nr:efflux RND transporter periplasmic adaptor subunit [Actinomyces culturomici]
MSTSTRSGRILNIAKTVIWAIIAIALVKFAFFPGGGADAEPQSLDPSANYGQMTITPTRGDITNTVTAKGTVEADAATTVKSTGEGTVSYIALPDGSQVDTGAPILEVRKEIQGQDSMTTDDEGNQTVVPGKTTYEYTTIYATASGTLRLSALLGQQFAIGDPVATIQPPTFSAVAPLNADQLYRIQNAPNEATLTITNGPAPFTCSGLQIVTPDKAPKTGDQNGAAQTTGIQAKCAIPGDQKVFPGLQVTMDVVAGSAQGVLTLPISAVEGRFQSGYVYVPDPDGGDPAKKPVKLGLTDGKVVEIVEGLSESDEVLEFVPSKSQDATDGSSGGSGDTGFSGGAATGEGA